MLWSSSFVMGQLMEGLKDPLQNSQAIYNVAMIFDQLWQ